MDPKGLLDIFISESDELTAELEQGLLVLETNPGDDEAIHRIFRSAHTLKSNAGMVGIAPIVELAHVAESVLSRVRARELIIDKALISVLLATVDALKAMLGQVISGVPVQLPEAHRSALDSLTAFTSAAATQEPANTQHSTEPPSGARVYRIDMAFRRDLFAYGQDPALLLLELRDLGDVLEVSANTTALPALEAMDPLACYFEFSVTLQTERPRTAIENVFVFVRADNTITITDVTAKRVDATAAGMKLGEILVADDLVVPRDSAEELQQQKLGKVDRGAVDAALAKQTKAREQRRSSTIRVDTDKLDRLVNLVGEMVIAISHVSQTTAESATYAQKSAVEALDQIGRELQAQVMSVRMRPIEETFNRFKRTVRDLAEELDKHVVLETSGTETELDKTVIEQLAAPLKHMVRNAVAHGLESPAERLESGKSDTGRIQLKAAQRQGHIVIEVSDDGRGIDPKAVLAKAKAMGLVGPGEEPDDKRVLDLVFRPGFSTATQVDEISGRGVGLDVVRRNVENLRGTVEVNSTVGRGTTFRIKLPLTLAIIDGMNVRVGRETLTIPLLSVVELISPRTDQIATVEGKGELVNVRGEYLPMIRLSEILETTEGAERQESPVVVIVENEARKFGIMVDKVLGMDQTVVKPLEKAFSIVRCLERGYRKPDGVSGATILGDGNVALILDVPGLERMAFGELR